VTAGGGDHWQWMRGVCRGFPLLHLIWSRKAARSWKPPDKRSVGFTCLL